MSSLILEAKRGTNTESPAERVAAINAARAELRGARGALPPRRYAEALTLFQRVGDVRVDASVTRVFAATGAGLFRLTRVRPGR